MYPVLLKEWRQFFSSLSGLLTVSVFLLINGLVLFVFADTDILSYGYASLDTFFDVAPYIFLQLIPALTMRSFSEEFKYDTYVLLLTKPLSREQIVGGKFGACALIVGFVLLLTLFYPYTLSVLSLSEKGLDAGATAGAYTGLFALGLCFVSIGIFASSCTSHIIVAFLMSSFLGYFFYDGWGQIAKLYPKSAFFSEWLGLEYHFSSIRKGVVDMRDVLYFILFIGTFLLLTLKRLYKNY